MDEPYFRYLSRPKLEAPVFVEGLPGFGDVGKIVARLLIESSGAELFAELYSPFFPDYVIVGKDGICRPPRYEFYASSTEKPHSVVLTGDAQPSEDVVAHYELCDKVMDFIEEHGCKFVVTIGGMPTPRPEKKVYVAATSSKLASEIMKKGAAIYGGGRIVGATGLLLGFAKKRGLDGICLLGPTSGLRPDREAALSVFKFLKKVLGILK